MISKFKDYKLSKLRILNFDSVSKLGPLWNKFMLEITLIYLLKSRTAFMMKNPLYFGTTNNHNTLSMR
jgi:hypothetical protein